MRMIAYLIHNIRKVLTITERANKLFSLGPLEISEIVPDFPDRRRCHIAMLILSALRETIVAVDVTAQHTGKNGEGSEGVDCPANEKAKPRKRKKGGSDER